MREEKCCESVVDSWSEYCCVNERSVLFWLLMTNGAVVLAARIHRPREVCRSKYEAVFAFKSDVMRGRLRSTRQIGIETGLEIKIEHETNRHSEQTRHRNRARDEPASRSTRQIGIETGLEIKIEHETNRHSEQARHRNRARDEPASTSRLDIEIEHETNRHRDQARDQNRARNKSASRAGSRSRKELETITLRVGNHVSTITLVLGSDA
ncbi:hypothetical protein EVAR_32183_1 [Eumeta japonica]|uniref:Uncharacterized protein n=1 Tax=Eumeta variegata TaxID=151549 RepID=A0A4C1W0K1_EUMVA|nr:hypothetical protein EVAR_32183_1 [Eumeta japonica]